jgi:hypothetical protein
MFVLEDAAGASLLTSDMSIKTALEPVKLIEGSFK